MKRALLLFAFAIAGCTAPVAGGLVEDDANRVMVALERVGVDAQKEVDPASEGRYRVLVPRDEAARAVSALRDEELPPHASPGVLDAMGKSSLVPSGAVEHAQLAIGLAGELERTLMSIDGVVSARVHVSLPPTDPFGDAPRSRATASVLVKHRGATPPLEPAAIQRLVAGAAAGMRSEDVAVVTVSRPSIAASELRLAHVGPIAVARGSAGLLRGLAAFALVVILALASGLVFIWRRGRVAPEVERAT